MVHSIKMGKFGIGWGGSKKKNECSGFNTTTNTDNYFGIGWGGSKKRFL
jgi:hypothetical protein